MSNTKVKHYENGNIQRIKMRNDDDRFHNTSGPAVQECMRMDRSGPERIVMRVDFIILLVLLFKNGMRMDRRNIESIG